MGKGELLLLPVGTLVKQNGIHRHEEIASCM